MEESTLNLADLALCLRLSEHGVRGTWVFCGSTTTSRDSAGEALRGAIAISIFHPFSTS
jgi:hypothetical protein